MPKIRTRLLMIWAIAYWSERSRPLLTRNRLNRKRFVREENQKTATRSETSRKIWSRLNEMAGRGAVQSSGIPAALMALTVKKTIAETLRIVVTIAMKLVSSLNRAKKRRTSSLWSARARSRPAAKIALKASTPRNET